MENYELAYLDYKAGMKYKDIAQKYSVSVDTVKKWKTRYRWTRKNVHKTCTQNKKGVHSKSLSETTDIELIKRVEQNEELTDKQRFFCLCYMKNFNATQAAREAGYDPDSARWIGYELLTKPYISAEINQLKKIKAQSIFISQEDIIERYMRIAFSDITDFVDFFTEEVPVVVNGKVLTVPDAYTGEPIIKTKTVNVIRFKDAATVDGGLISEISQGKDGAKIKLEDRQKALDWLANYFSMNPMDKHKVVYDNARLDLERQKVELNKDIVKPVEITIKRAEKNAENSEL